MFYIFGISLSFFLSFLLFTKKGKSNTDLILACWLTITGIHLFAFHISNEIQLNTHPYFIFAFALPTIHGPMLYFYTASITNQHNYLKKFWWTHLIPALIIVALYLPFLFLSQEEQNAIVANEGKTYRTESLIQTILVDLTGVIYIILSLYLLRQHKKNIKTNFSSTSEKNNLQWLRLLCIGMSAIWLGVFLCNDKIIFSLVTLFVFFLGYFGIKQMGIFGENPIIQETSQNTTFKKVNPNLIEIHKNLIEYIKENKVYLNPELTLAELSKHINVHPNILSQVINTVEEKTFYDFINLLRIEEFKKTILLEENQKFTMLSLAYDCGFNSKTAFYRNFKNQTGMSPSEYLNQQNISLK